ncbi:hypothetical protein H5407_05660 [Mitsuaria sp. WAJ17]|uniref:DUF6229 family protein n=1 Tax=Mitsuaria sp. WAJ17 TaxID=2761452 RepID=UPI001601415E|nr:DUF6229 family protein [Mitsuaria sp. WAJ17]MBB2484709.1 hypothetical protein [Mitsuaria sp. WAJ17]
MNEITSALQQVEQWMQDESAASPAGPLFSSGVYSEAEIAGDVSRETRQGCSSCSGSRTIMCC